MYIIKLYVIVKPVVCNQRFLPSLPSSVLAANSLNFPDVATGTFIFNHLKPQDGTCAISNGNMLHPNCQHVGFN